MWLDIDIQMNIITWIFKSNKLISKFVNPLLVVQGTRWSLIIYSFLANSNCIHVWSLEMTTHSQNFEC